MSTKTRRPRVDKGSTRPYRLWDPIAKQNLRWRYYAHPRNAHLGALIEARWSKPDTVIEVYNAVNGELLGQYKRLLTSIAFIK